MNILGRINFYLATLLISISCSRQSSVIQNRSIKEVMDIVITRLYEEVPTEKYKTIDDDIILNFLNDEEKSVLATRYQYFRANVPVTVSLMRNVSQPTLPFWLEESGFIKTDKTVKNDEYEYEVWQKDFDAGWVNLGINGFDMHRTVYFICVGPKINGDQLEINEYFPAEFSIETMKKGAFTYHDWSSLLITELPDELVGQRLFTTVRGRAREAHVKGAFRSTKYSSSLTPDQILLTWSSDPTTTVDIQWRTNDTVESGLIKYWKTNDPDTQRLQANKFVMEDRMLYNDRYIHRFTAKMENLVPNSVYEYVVGTDQGNNWSSVKSFKTQAKNQNRFSFIWFGDTHRSQDWGELLQIANTKHPEIAFYSIAGDIVSTGLYRNEWDELFAHSGDVFSNKPLMPVPGNHDRQDGLGAWMYYEMFSLPQDAPDEVHSESTYAFNYGNALFLMIDSTHPIEEQSTWIEEKLKNTSATWKFAMFHFPPYNFEEPYPDIQEAWCTIFDKYHVDMVMSGHVHYYMRSKPMNNGRVVSTFDKGTVYTISIGTSANHGDIGEEPYAEVRYKDGQFYQLMEINENVLNYTTYDQGGEIKDHFTIIKPNTL